MKTLLLACGVFLCIALNAQSGDSVYKKYIDSIVGVNIVRLDAATDNSFERTAKDGQKELWQCDTINDSLFQFRIVHYKDPKRKYDEHFLLLNGKLIYAEDGEGYSTSNEESDVPRWSEQCYFKDGKLVDYISLGHGKSEDENYDFEKAVRSLYKKRSAELRLYLKKKK